MLFTELGIVHTSGVGGKVICMVADLLRQFGIGDWNAAEAGDQFADLALVQPAFLMQADPSISAFDVVGKEQACQLPQVLAGVEEVDDLNRSREVILGDVPDPAPSPMMTFFSARGQPRFQAST